MVEGDPPSTTVDARSGAAGTLILNRRTRHRAIRAEHAALTFDRLHAVAAVLAIVDVTAGVRRHGLKCLVATGRTSNDGKQFHGSSPGPGRANGRLDPVAAPGSIGPKADTIKKGPMPPRIDLEPQENASTGPKDSQIGGGRYPHGHRKTGRNSSLPRVPTKHPRVAVAARRLKRSEPVPPQQRKQLARLPDGLSRSGKMQVGVLE